MVGPRVVYHPNTDSDLDGLLLFIAARDGKDRALQVLDRIERAISNLAHMPRMGLHRPYLDSGVLSFSCKRWTIIYEPLSDGTGVHVLRVVDGRRHLPALFGKSGRKP